MSEYLADGRPIEEAEFTRLACDPAGSAVVEACAGSGKTWLLVSRIVRLLLAGAAPGDILAITFTRRAAHEMQARLLRDLRQLASAGDAEIRDILQMRGMTEAQATQAIPVARHLYERVVTARVPLTIETFHGWFWQLVSRAPLGCGVPFVPSLLEATGRTRSDAWLHFVSALVRPEHAAERAGWELLLDELGETAARSLLEAFVDKRAEWWSFSAASGIDPEERVLRAFGACDDDDPAAAVRAPQFVQAVGTLMQSWRTARPTLKAFDQAAARAEAWLSGLVTHGAIDLRNACHLVLTKGEMTPVRVLAPDRVVRDLASEAERRRYAEAYAHVVRQLEHLCAERRVWRARRVNQAGVRCGKLLLAMFQAQKEREQALDFTDLEWHAYRLLSDADNAAYMQARLDARYRHVLLDEFQDTNALQWQVMQSWLAAYGERGGDDDGAMPAAARDRPTVFVVGDPKQSIYRFRRAEPRAFDAAIELLGRDFAAVHLRTNVTRRNAQRLVDVLNRCMPPGNPLFQPQSTRVDAAVTPGAFVLLPLAEPESATAAGAASAGLRDVLTMPRPERDNDTRYREGRVIANEIAAWRSRLRGGREGEQPARWSDVLLLVRRRTHLPQYERALRDARVPFVSDRSGGLLNTLEADDITALLQFLSGTDTDLHLAHALRSPIFGCSDADLIRLAEAPGTHWWQRLLGLANPPPDLARARRLLQRWLDLSGVLPVHDLLDRIYFEGDSRRRYAAAAPAALQAQVEANLDALIELALALDAGRFPSLPRFIDELSALKGNVGNDAPDEGIVTTGDAVRVMTIHGAKGLEAEIVVLADAYAAAPTEDAGVLVAWPPDRRTPEHLSLVVRGQEARDGARRGWFDEDDLQRRQEDWNLLYVAATRARQVLIVSGSAPVRGSLNDTWHQRLDAARGLSLGASPAMMAPATAAQRCVRDFLPTALPTGSRTPDHLAESDAQRLGRAWHALLELGEGASTAAIAQAHALDARQSDEVEQAALRVRSAWPHLFGAGSLAEVEVFGDQGERLRFDRLVEHGGEFWIIDFKWRATAAERPQHEAQVRRYGAVLRAIHPDRTVRLALVTANAEFIEVV